MFLSFKVLICSLLSLNAKIPPCIFGCKVLTLPSNISSKFVILLTSMTSILFSFKYLYVPPVEIISIPLLTKKFAKSNIPILSYTEIKALFFISIPFQFTII